MIGQPSLVLFRSLQDSALLALAHPATAGLVALAIASHYRRMIGITLCFHRHMAHRAFRLSRPVRFLFAWLGVSALQKALAALGLAKELVAVPARVYAEARGSAPRAASFAASVEEVAA